MRQEMLRFLLARCDEKKTESDLEGVKDCPKAAEEDWVGGEDWGKENEEDELAEERRVEQRATCKTHVSDTSY